MREFGARLWKCARLALPKSGRVSLWLLKIILPVSLLVRFLQYYGVIDGLASYLNPVFSYIGLPGYSAIVFITSCFLPLYASIAIMTSLVLTIREATILALMCLTSHNLPVECAVTRKTGSSFWAMVVLRIGMAFVIAVSLNALMPADNRPFGMVTQNETYDTIGSLLQAWLLTSFTLAVTIIVIVTILMILQRLLDEFNLIDFISKPLSPFMKVFGLPRKAPFLWIVGNVVGLAYGGAIMYDMVEEGKISLEETNVVNHHLAVSHSLLEDTILFVALGISVWWIIGTRLFFAFAVVWMYRWIRSLRRVKDRPVQS